MIRIFFIILISLQATISFAQYKWRLEKDKDDIKVYSSETPRSSFRAIKVDCLMTGTYARLISVLSNIPTHTDWIYRAKTTRLLQSSPGIIIYYLESEMPWPLTNRDAVIQLHMMTDSLPRFLAMTGSVGSNLVPENEDKVRIKYYTASWMVTMPAPQKIHIQYILEIDPAGSLPAWMANMFIEKGPYETFSNLAKKLKEP